MSILRDELLGAAPTSFRVLLPPGWRQFGVDDASRAALEALIRDRLKPAGRPDLDAQLRSMVRRYWERLERTRAVALYLPTEPATQVPLPMSIVASKYSAAPGRSLEADLRATVGVEVTRVELPAGPVLRWTSTGDGADGDGGVRSVTIGPVFPVPGDDPQHGMMLLTGIPHLADGGTDVLLEPLAFLSDAIAETFRWS
ncbi:MAG TPA: hypothetical protein VF156_14225 [Agromyces sp.]